VSSRRCPLGSAVELKRAHQNGEPAPDSLDGGFPFYEKLSIR
jgi:hypothetical protein